MSIPLVSVVIPTYNRASTVSEAIESALAQTYPRLELIVVDDGSTDDSPDILAHFGKEIHVIQQANAGPSAARNRGVGSARGELIAFLDSDDTWFPTKIESQTRVIEEAGPSLPCCLSNILLPHLPFGRATSFALADLHPAFPEGVWSNPAEVLLHRFVLFNQALLVRRGAFIAAGGFKTQFRLLEDYDLALRLAALGPWGFVKAPLVSYGTGESNSLSSRCRTDKTAAPASMMQILNELAKTNPFRGGPFRRALRRQIRRAQLTHCAATWGSCGWGLRAGLGRGLELGMRWRDGLVRRSWLLPQMRVLPAGEYRETCESIPERQSSAD